MEALDVLGNSLTAMIKHPKFFLPQLVAALFLAFSTVIVLASVTPSGTSPTSAQMAEATVAAIPGFLAITFIYFILEAIIFEMYCYLALNWRNNDVSLAQSLVTSVGRFVPFIIYSVIFGVAFMIIALIIFSPVLSAVYGMSLSGSASPAQQASLQLTAIVSAFVLLIIAAIVSPFIMLTSTLIVVEKKGVMESILAGIAYGKKDFVWMDITLAIGLIIYAGIYLAAGKLSSLGAPEGFLGFLLTVVVTQFIFLIAPMYYVTVGKKVPAQMQSAAPTATGQTSHHSKRKQQ